jgi:hypothetical protein
MSTKGKKRSNSEAAKEFLDLPLTVLTEHRACGPCRECCVAFLLSPNPEYWPEGKPAHAPCRFLDCDGCSIHDQPRPNVRTKYQCAYLYGDVPWRPDQVGVIFNLNFLWRLFQGELETLQAAGAVPGDWQGDAVAIRIFEARPRAVLALEPHKVRGE